MTTSRRGEMSSRVGGTDTCGGDPREARTPGGWSAASGGRQRRLGGARRPGPAQGARPGAQPVGLSGVGGALRGPSPGDKGPAAPPSPGAARAPALRARAGLGAYLGRPTRPGRRGLRVRAQRAAACSGARSTRAAAAAAAAAAEAGAAASASASRSVSHRGGEGRRRQAAGGGTGEGGGIWLRAGGGGAATATPRGGGAAAGGLRGRGLALGGRGRRAEPSLAASVSGGEASCRRAGAHWAPRAGGGATSRAGGAGSRGAAEPQSEQRGGAEPKVGRGGGAGAGERRWPEGRAPGPGWS